MASDEAVNAPKDENPEHVNLKVHTNLNTWQELFHLRMYRTFRPNPLSVSIVVNILF